MGREKGWGGCGLEGIFGWNRDGFLEQWNVGVGDEGKAGWRSGSGRTQSMTIKEVSERALSNSALLEGESNVLA